jgi:hypothetical protein
MSKQRLTFLLRVLRDVCRQIDATNIDTGFTTMRQPLYPIRLTRAEADANVKGRYYSRLNESPVHIASSEQDRIVRETEPDPWDGPIQPTVSRENHPWLRYAKKFRKAGDV